MAAVTTHDADTNYLVRQSMSTGFQILSLLTPPLYTTIVLTKRGRGAWSLNRFLRATWVGGLTGTACGGGAAYGRYKNSNGEFVHQRRLEVTYDTNRIRARDHSTVGAVIMAMLTPAIFWNRANIANLILGGASLGSGIGTLTHYARVLTGGDPPNQVVVVTLEGTETE